MQVNSTNMYSTSFQAKIPNHIRTKILKERTKKELNKKTDLVVELGLQTIHEKTSNLINRCHSLSQFESMVKKLQEKLGKYFNITENEDKTYNPDGLCGMPPSFFL